jgi:hypothetical protein
VKEDAPDHPKMKKLRRLLKIPLPYANGIMERLWNFTGRYEPDGGIGRKSDDEICEACAMPDETDSAEFIGALIAAGFLDVMDSCRLFVHDWPQHCTHYIHNRIARKKAFFANGEAPSLKRLGPRYRSEIESFYKSQNRVSAQKPPLSAQKPPLSAQTESVSAQTRQISARHPEGVSAQTGQISAHGDIVRARVRPTPTPTPTNTETLCSSELVLNTAAAAQNASVKMKPCSRDSNAVAAALRKFGKITRTASAQFVAACLNGSNSYSEREIVYAIETVGATLTPAAKNPVGILLSQVPQSLPECVEAMKEEHERKTNPQIERDRDRAQLLLLSSDTPAAEREWANKILGRTK